MGYSSTSDAVAEFKSLELNNNTVSSAKVTEFIAQAHAYLNARVSCKVETPVVLATSPNSYAILKNIETYLVCHRIAGQLRVQTGDADLDQDPVRNFKKEAEDMIKMIIKGELKLEDATARTTHDGHQCYMVDEDKEAVFDADTDQW